MIVLHPLLKLFFNTGKHWFAKTNTKYPIFSAYGVRTVRVGIPRISMCGRVGILGGEHHTFQKLDSEGHFPAISFERVL